MTTALSVRNATKIFGAQVALDDVSIDVEPGEVPRFSAPRELFRFPADSFDVSPDGQRFAVSSFTDGGVDKPLTLITGWTQRMGKP